MNVLLIDDHALFREGLALLLRPLMTGVDGIWMAGSCAEGLALLEARGPVELALMDLSMPGTPGLEGIALVRKRWPRTTVVALSSADDTDTVLAAIDAGAMGFIPKSSTPQILQQALHRILGRSVYLPPFLRGGPAPLSDRNRAASASPDAGGACTPADLGLSPRETDALFLIMQGMVAKQIEKELDLSASTVKKHTSAVLRALNVTTRTQAVVKAASLGLRFPENAGRC